MQLEGKSDRREKEKKEKIEREKRKERIEKKANTGSLDLAGRGKRLISPAGWRFATAAVAAAAQIGSFSFTCLFLFIFFASCVFCVRESTVRWCYTPSRPIYRKGKVVKLPFSCSSLSRPRVSYLVFCACASPAATGRGLLPSRLVLPPQDNDGRGRHKQKRLHA